MGMVELDVLLCNAGEFNVHVGVAKLGEEECVGKFGWGTRNGEDQKLVKLMVRNGTAIAGSFFQKWKSHKITYRRGQHPT